MTTSSEHDAWSLGRSYDEYMGRWSRSVADVFLERLAPAEQLRWLDVGCGTGALTSRIVATCSPSSVIGIDPSSGFIERASVAVGSHNVRFETGSADALPMGADTADVVASALAYNFVPDRAAALAEFRRVCSSGGTVAFYVWDYPGGGVGFIDEFWKHAARLDPSAGALDEADRFPFCTDAGLAAEMDAGGFAGVSVEAIEILTPFDDFDAFWHPFTLGAGPAPGYLGSLPADAQDRLRTALESGLEGRTDQLTARAWAVFAVNP